MKTPEDIKKGLECCMVEECFGEKENCPYTADPALCVGVMCGDALDYIQQLEARVPRWIPVEERLPEAGVDVALVIRSGDVSCVRSGWWTSGHMSGFICPGDQSLDGFNVTHWMPLPEPPEEV